MDEKKLEQQLKKEDFTNIYIHRDSPNVFYPKHTHSKTTTNIILEGEMEITVKDVTKKYKAGDRVDVPANELHSARIGPKGCKYIIAKK